QTVVQDGDLVHVMMRSDDVERVEAAFAEGPQEGGQ
ncbi:TrkA family potassium uptake protein, partial [Streptomyces sp. SID11233]|nr:TrkA family potassium uptake protein [Streptomyces sp. SID11233]